MEPRSLSVQMLRCMAEGKGMKRGGEDTYTHPKQPRVKAGHHSTYPTPEGGGGCHYTKGLLG